MGFLTEKDKARLARVKALLAEGVNPYASIETLVVAVPNTAKSTHEVSRRSVVRPISKIIGITRDGKLTTRKPIPKTSILNCLVCCNPLDFVTSVKARVFTNLRPISVLERIQHRLVEVEKMAPVFKTGRVCQHCAGNSNVETVLEQPEG